MHVAAEESCCVQSSFWLQDYVRELGICLAIGGDALRGNIANANGQRMATLQAELCQLCTCKANIDLEAHRAFVASPLLPALHSSTSGGAADPDWLQLGVSTADLQAAFTCHCKLMSTIRY